MGKKRLQFREVLLLALWISAAASAQRDDAGLAYIGPGAGFAFVGSLLTFLSGFAMGVGSLLLWPFRMTWRVIRRRQGFSKARVKRLIFFGR